MEVERFLTDLRDKFAAQAMAAILTLHGVSMNQIEVAKKAYIVADAMLKERTKKY